eukprot:GHVU01021971.1.p1 GENE.GHVU01021971.1~~GHVU01021971.1.p1  ORF type:complete len:142 (+),score=25.70 GHVU01021971.1:1976-2401(+)
MQKAANELKKGFDVSETGAPSAVSSRRSHQRGSDAGAAAGTATRAERRLRSSGDVNMADSANDAAPPQAAAVALAQQLTTLSPEQLSKMYRYLRQRSGDAFTDDSDTRTTLRLADMSAEAIEIALALVYVMRREPDATRAA